MSIIQTNLEDWIEPRYKEYSLYTCMKRAIPHLIDGLKPSQRKILYTAIRRAKSMVKVASLGGYVLAEANYKHGDSVTGTISLMGQDFVGSNNFPLLDKKGGFGNRFGASPSAPRYIYVKLSDFFDQLFLKLDEEILLPSDDLEDPDPSFYVPIIPYALLNGINGIAVGFSVNIPSYNPLDIIKNIEYILKGSSKRLELRPYYRGYNGEILKIDGQWTMYGKFNKINTTTIEVTEIPIGITRESYKEHLNKLIDKDIIKDYDDMSDKNWRFIIRAHREFVVQSDDKIMSELNLVQKIFEKINVIFDNKILEYENPIQLIEDFVKIRLGFYELRQKNMLTGYQKDILKFFIKYSVNMYIKTKGEKKFDKEEAISYIEKKKPTIIEYYKDMVSGYDENKISDIFDENFKGIMDTLRLNELYSDKIKEYQDKIEALTLIHNTLFEKKREDLYQEDLKNLKKAFSK